MSARKDSLKRQRLAFVDHDLVLIVPDDDIDGPDHVYFSGDWCTYSGPSAIVDNDGDAAFLDGWGKPYKWVKIREIRCASEHARAERLFRRDFE
jgi:hypothetical protein